MIATVTVNPALDKTVYVSRLTPNDTNRVINDEVDAGGKGINCSRMLKRLGEDTLAITFLGGSPGEYIKMVVEREGVPLNIVETAKPTRTCIAVEESKNVPPTTLNEVGGPVDHKEFVELLERVKNLSRECEYVVFGGSVPAGINDDVYKVLIEIAAAGGAKTVLDSDGTALAMGIKARPFMIKPNRAELERLLGVNMESKGDVARAAMAVADKGIELVVVSLGKQGAIACYDGMIYSAVAPTVKTISTIGSGDSMIAGMVSALKSGSDIEEALRLGCAAGAATAMSGGSDIGAKEDIDRLVSQVEITTIQPSAAKV